MANKPTPRIQFQGGPLDGQTRDKTAPGRWSRYLDLMGDAFHYNLLSNYSQWYVLESIVEEGALRTGHYTFRSVTK